MKIIFDDRLQAENFIAMNCPIGVRCNNSDVHDCLQCWQQTNTVFVKDTVYDIAIEQNNSYINITSTTSLDDVIEEIKDKLLMPRQFVKLSICKHTEEVKL